jgi:hypothetical protein
MDIGEVLTKAWNTIWKHKILWVFGILASCGQGGGGGSGGGGGNTGYQFSGGDPNVSPDVERFFDGADRFFQQIEAAQIIGFIAILLVFFLILWFVMLALSTIGRVGLIQGTVKAEDSTAQFTFMELFESGKPFFWRILGLNVLIGLAAFVLVLLIVLPLVGITALTFGIGLLCLIPLICLMIPVSWVITIIIEQANIAIILEDIDIFTGVRRGWEIFRDNLGNIIVMALILLIGGWLVGIIFALPIFLVVFPAVFGAVLGGFSDSALPFGGGIAMAALCFVGYLPILIVLGGILRAFIQSAWTLTYIQLTQPKLEADEVLESEPEEPEEQED